MGSALERCGATARGLRRVGKEHDRRARLRSGVGVDWACDPVRRGSNGKEPSIGARRGSADVVTPRGLGDHTLAAQGRFCIPEPGSVIPFRLRFMELP